MIGLGSEVLIFPSKDQRERVENLSVGDEIFCHFTNSLVAIEDIMIRTIRRDNSNSYSEELLAFEAIYSGERIANQWNIISRRLIPTVLPHGLESYLQNNAAILERAVSYSEVFSEEFFVQFELRFSRAVLASVGDFFCLFDANRWIERQFRRNEDVKPLLINA